MKKIVSAKMPVNGKNALVTVLYEDNIPLEICVDKDVSDLRCTDIYVGHVEKILDATGGAFVRLTKDDVGFLPQNRIKDPVFASVKKDGILKAGDELLVQVETEKIGNKQPVLTCRLKLPGNKELLQEIKEKGVHRTAPCCLYKAPMSWKMLLMRCTDDEFSELVTDSEDIYRDPDSGARLYSDKMVSLYRLYNMSSLLEEAASKKVWMKDGGYLFIEQTEAFVSIDVNSGKAVRGKASDETFLKINMEAARECFSQIRLRQLSGTILVDFISMKSKEAEDTLLHYAKELAEKDPVYTNVVDITSLGIMEITRHKTRRSLNSQIMSL